MAEVLEKEGTIQNFLRKQAPCEGAPYGIQPEVMENYVKSCGNSLTFIDVSLCSPTNKICIIVHHANTVLGKVYRNHPVSPSIHISHKHNSYLTDQLILMKLYIVEV